MSEDTKLTENQRAEHISLFPDWAVEKGLTLGDLINDPEYKVAYEEWAKNNPDIQRVYRAFANSVTRPLVDQTVAFKRTLDSVTKPFANQAIALQRKINSIAWPFANHAAEFQRTFNRVTRPLAEQAIELQRKGMIDGPINIATLPNTVSSPTVASVDIKLTHLHVVDAIHKTSEQTNQEIRSVKHEIEQMRSDIDIRLSSKQNTILGWVAAIAAVIKAVEAILPLILSL